MRRLTDSELYDAVAISCNALMILVDLIAGKPSFMGNLMGFDEMTIKLSHCAMPFLIAGEKARYSLADYHGGRWPGATARVFLPKGEAVTVLRISGRWGEAVVAEGTLLGQEDQGCRNTLRIELSDFGVCPKLPRLLHFLGFRVKTI